MNDFTILHLSDLHFNKKGKQLPDLMVNLLSDIKEQLKYINNLIIVVTGDLVHRGNYEYKNSVLTFFEKLSDIVGSKAKDIYDVYAKWCDSNGYGTENKQNFFAELKNKGVFSNSGTVEGKTVKNIVKGYIVNDDFITVDDDTKLPFD